MHVALHGLLTKYCILVYDIDNNCWAGEQGSERGNETGERVGRQEKGEKGYERVKNVYKL